ncbi:type III secretion apparatus needle protein [Providencia alcalifaciens]|nr:MULTISPECIES: type III secretion apparatus needle protein [Providencia]HCI94762.1 type III secretion apparatus needle protein [Providencia sp.]ELR5057133.1 type III secretion apparatus needle protein [Providencia rettgeri]ELR5086729.1 type III secretion apparatus needle protein [Providencia rettgeri]ELR5109197.1 type III secretion apparatus needle protein [Providencia rettgeri]ELR5283557.1 type III secretion apparatus needle protein [Providencia rettgeri]
MSIKGMAKDTAGDPTTGEWVTTMLEAPPSTINSKYGMMYRASAGISARTKVIADELHTMINDDNLEVDNPLVLGKITALSGNYNMARQLQSNVMKSIKDAAQAIIRNV